VVLEKLKHGYQLPGASEDEILGCEAKLSISLPDEYRVFLKTSNGFNDDVGHGYLVLWSVDELAAADAYGIFEFRNERFLIGSNGGPTAYGVIDGNYISLPFVAAGAWEDEVRILGGNFAEFITAIETGQGW
jgi:hypothetical protein